MQKSQTKTALVAAIVAALVLVGGVVAFTASSDDSSTTESTNQVTSDTAEAEASTLAYGLNLTNLEPLAQGEYEGWVVRGDDKTSFGRFNTTESGEVVGELTEPVELQDGDTIAISIEPDNDADPGPSATIVLAGTVENGAASLAFPVDVSTFAGQYILATPTTAAQDDETAGVWFTITGSDASLDIPVAPEGWIYEGWVVVDGVPYTTGQFTDPAAADMFNDYSGPGNAPNKPGEDFITNLPNGVEGPLNLQGATIVVSLEPYQDGTDPTGPMPAQVKPLTHTVAADAIDHSAFDLMTSSETLPSGSIRI